MKIYNKGELIEVIKKGNCYGSIVIFLDGLWENTKYISVEEGNNLLGVCEVITIGEFRKFTINYIKKYLMECECNTRGIFEINSEIKKEKEKEKKEELKEERKNLEIEIKNCKKFLNLCY